MGMSRWDDSAWACRSTATAKLSRDQIFRQQGMHADLDPSKVKVREARDSEANPNATPIILACDETGSMGALAEIIIKTGLGTIMKSIYEHKPVSDPQILCMGVGDAFSDRAPLQVTQFESEVAPMLDQIEKIWLEGNGGSNRGESYSLAWLFAGYKVASDAWIKRRKKGYLFTIGDECPHPHLTRDQVMKSFGVGVEADIPTELLLQETQQFWNVFHLVVQPVPYQPVLQTWGKLLGNNAIVVEDTTKIAEVITAVIRLTEGQSHVDAGLDPGTALVVRNATKSLVR